MRRKTRKLTRPPTLTDLPSDYKLRLLNTMPQGDRGRLSMAVRGFNELERDNRKKKFEAGKKISKVLDNIPFTVQHTYKFDTNPFYNEITRFDLDPPRKQYLKGLEEWRINRNEQEI
eukprot:SAG31_NODE_14755_length_789_cov_0.952174_2_plen_117_part_00